MIISVDNYHEDVSYKGIKTYLSYGRIGLYHLESGKKTLSSFHRVIITDKCVFIEVDGRMGILDLDLSLIVPPVYKDILSVNKIARESYVSSCMSNQSAVSITLDSNSNTPTHIAIQTNAIDANNRIEGLRLTYYNEFEEEDKACIYEVVDSLEDAQTGLFVTISDEEVQLIDIDNIEIKQNSCFRDYEFLPLWHYKDNMFIIRNNNGTYVTSTYKDGRFTKRSLWGEFDDSFEDYGSPKIVVHRGEFISVCYPERYRYIGSPFANQEKEKVFAEKKGKWALFKYYHKKIEEDDKRWHKFLSNERTCFEQLTSFVFVEPMTQLLDDNEFICHGDGIDFFMRFEQRGTEASESVKVDERYETKPCFQGQLNIIACYNSIELRDDGLYDVSTDDGYGLCDKDMQVIVPAKYDYPIEGWGYQLMIVSRKGKYGVINQKAENIIPCRYDYIQIGKDEFHIWDKEYDWDQILNESVPNYSIRNKIDMKISDGDLIKEGYIIIGITKGVPNVAIVTTEAKTLFEKLARIAAKTHSSETTMTHCDVYSPNGQFLSKCEVSKSGVIEFDKDLGLLVIFDCLQRYGVYIQKSSSSTLTSDDFSDATHSLNGNSSDGYSDLEEIIITKEISKVEWNGLGRCRFRKFKVDPENKVFCEADGVLYTQKGYDRKGDTQRKRMIELVACPTNVSTHNVMAGTIRIANCAFKGSNVEKLNLPDTLEEIGVNAFYLANQIKELEIPLSIRKIESQDVGKSGAPSPTIKYDGHVFLNWEDLYTYMCEHGFERKYGNVIKI